MQERPTLAATRRDFFRTVSGGICGAALSYLLGRDLYGGSASPAAEPAAVESSAPRSYDLRPQRPHFEPRAKAVIHLFMNGGPSQVDLFDPKPQLDRRHGQGLFDKIAGEV